MRMYTVDELKLSILAYFWNVRFWRDRQAKAFHEDTNELTGLPNREAALLPGYRSHGGDRLALEVTPCPGDLAASMVKVEINGEMKQIDTVRKDLWTEEQREFVGVLTFRMKLAAHKLGEEGALNLHPNDDTGSPQPFGDDDMVARFQMTYKGLNMAREAVKGTPFEYAPRGWEDALASSEKQFAPDWLKRQWSEGNVSGTNSRLDMHDTGVAAATAARTPGAEGNVSGTNSRLDMNDTAPAAPATKMEGV